MRFCGVKRPVAARSDKDAGGCLTGGRIQDRRAIQESVCLDPADGDDGVSDEAVTVVHVRGRRHVLPTVEKQYPNCADSARRIVNPTAQREGAPGAPPYEIMTPSELGRLSECG
jgi:hypothetical protein